MSNELARLTGSVPVRHQAGNTLLKVSGGTAALVLVSAILPGGLFFWLIVAAFVGMGLRLSGDD